MMRASQNLHPILVAGVGPIPPERPERLYAPGLRVWGMARELARAGHPVALALAGFGQAGGGRLELTHYAIEPDRHQPRLSEPRRVEISEDELPAELARAAEQAGARAMVSSTDLMNHALALAPSELPLWCDFFGDPMAEAQMLALRGGSDEGLARQWSLVAPALARADRLSGCSRDQSAALLGQLGAVGRLGRHTAFAPLVAVLPPWLEPIPIDLERPPLVRGTRAPEDAFIIVQTGGFNTWLDVDTLFEALERAMEACGRIHFAATGGAIAGHYGGGFERFAGRVAASPHRERFHLLGWLPVGQVPRVIHEADLGLNLDLACPEGRLGTRNRLLDWLGAGLAVISTPGCELAEQLGTLNYIELVGHADAAGAARAILSREADPAPARARAAAGAEYLRREHEAAFCLAPLLNWAAAPESAPDLLSYRAGDGTPSPLLEQARSASRAFGQGRREALRVARLEQKLAALEGSRWIRLALWLRGRQGLGSPEEP